MKKLIIPIIIVVVVIVAAIGFVKLQPDTNEDGVEIDLLGGTLTNKANLIGSVTNYESLPNRWVEANSTTTDSGTVEDPSTITQFFNLKGATQIRLSGGAIAETATSSAYLTFQFSNDGTNWFNNTYSSTTDTLLVSSTSTINVLRNAQVLTYGTASTTFSYVFDVPVVDFMRVLLYQDNLSTDPNDGVQMWLEATKL